MKKNTLQRKIIFAFFLILLLPSFIMQNILLYASMTSLYETQAVANINNQNTAINKLLDTKFKQISSVTNLISTDPNLQNIVFSEKSINEKSDDFKNFILAYRSGFQEPIIQIKILTEEGVLYTADEIFHIDMKQWDHNLQNNNFNQYFSQPLYCYDTSISKLVHSISESIQFIKPVITSDGKDIYIIIDIPVSIIMSDIYSNIEHYQSFFLISQNNKTITEVNSLDINLSDLDTEKFIVTSSANVKKQIDKTTYYMSYSSLPNNNWLALLVTEPSVLFHSVIDDYFNYLTVVLFFTIILVVTTFIYIKKVFSPLLKLNKGMVDVIEGDLKTRVVVEADDEIGFLSKQFNLMLESIEKLVLSINTALTNRRKTEMALLQNQINPHFLYNTLASARYLNMSGKIPETDRIIRSITIILRKSISNKHVIIPLKEELEIAEQYLEIQKIMSEKDFIYQQDLESGSLEFPVPKFIIQPILENCFFHGFKNNKRPAKLKIKTRLLENNYLEIKIIDNGLGTNKKIEFRNNRKSESVGDDHIGLTNINRRLYLLYEKQYSFSFLSKKGLGSVTIIRFNSKNVHDITTL